MKDGTKVWYFSHDYHSRNDLLMQQLRMKHGLEGIGIYWCIIEMLHENNGYIMQTQCQPIAWALGCQCHTLLSVLQECNLFENDGEKFWSNRVLKNLDQRNSLSQKGKEAAKKRWSEQHSKQNNKNDDDANPMPTQCQPNAIKEKKRKENKRKEENTNISIPNPKEEINNNCITKKKGDRDCQGKEEREEKKEIPKFDFSNFNDEEVAAIKNFFEYKKERRDKSYKQIGLNNLRKKMLELSKNKELVIAIETSIANNWQGIFGGKNNANRNNVRKSMLEKIWEANQAEIDEGGEADDAHDGNMG